MPDFGTLLLLQLAFTVAFSLSQYLFWRIRFIELQVKHRKMLLKSFVVAGLAAVATAKSAVLDLIPSNFDKVVLESGKPTLVEFFAPWCGHCKNLAPVYEELALAFAHAKDKVQIAKVDADAERSLGQKFGVQGFPTLKWFDGSSSTPLDYNSGRDLESLSAFITDKTGVKPRKKMAAPSQVKMLTDETFSKTIGGEQHVLVAFTAPWCGRESSEPLLRKLSLRPYLITNCCCRLQGSSTYLGAARRGLRE